MILLWPSGCTKPAVCKLYGKVGKTRAQQKKCKLAEQSANGENVGAANPCSSQTLPCCVSKSPHLVVTQALGQATCKLPRRGASVLRPPPSGIDMGLSQAKESLPGSGSRDNILGLGTTQGSWAGPQRKKPVGCSINWHLEVRTQVFLRPYTMLPQAFPSACITQVLLLLQISGVYNSLTQPPPAKARCLGERIFSQKTQISSLQFAKCTSIYHGAFMGF